MTSLSSDERHAMLALTCTPHVGVIVGQRLVRELGTARAVYEHRTELPELIPEVRPSLVEALDCPEALRRAEEELAYIEKNHIRCLTFTDEAYPARLRECEDAPLFLHGLGNVDFNVRHVVSIIGTRHATEYGKELCAAFVRDLARLCPDLLIVSGLAYGIDVAAHRAALAEGVPTVGVLAHGLDRIYPAAHRNVAAQMVRQQGGGLLTEYMSGTQPDRQNFIQRNRIVAGLADATVVVESAKKGGALITAEMAIGYGRDCLAFPGRVGDEYSCGCNNLIRSNAAGLITSAEDFLQVMGWETAGTEDTPVQGQLFIDAELDKDERKIMAILRKADDNVHINTLVLETSIPYSRLTTILFNLEMKGLVRALPGSSFRALTL